MLCSCSAEPACTMLLIGGEQAPQGLGRKYGVWQRSSAQGAWRIRPGPCRTPSQTPHVHARRDTTAPPRMQPRRNITTHTQTPVPLYVFCSLGPFHHPHERCRPGPSAQHIAACWLAPRADAGDAAQLVAAAGYCHVQKQEASTARSPMARPDKQRTATLCAAALARSQQMPARSASGAQSPPPLSTTCRSAH
jgi:hypothetical protein